MSWFCISSGEGVDKSSVYGAIHLFVGADYDTRFRSVVTSYDYDAPLSEAGDPTEKLLAIRDVIKQVSLISCHPLRLIPWLHLCIYLNYDLCITFSHSLGIFPQAPCHLQPPSLPMVLWTWKRYCYFRFVSTKCIYQSTRGTAVVDHNKRVFFFSIFFFPGWKHQQLVEHAVPPRSSEIPVSSDFWRGETGNGVCLKSTTVDALNVL